MLPGSFLKTFLQTPFPLDGSPRHDHHSSGVIHFQEDSQPGESVPADPDFGSFSVKMASSRHTHQRVLEQSKTVSLTQKHGQNQLTRFIYRNKKDKNKTKPQSHSIYAAKTRKGCMSLDGHNRKRAQIQSLQNAHNQPPALFSIYILFFSLQSAS